MAVSPFAKAQAASFKALQSAAGTAVTYHRGASSVGLTAVPGSSNLQMQDDRGQVLQIKSSDWIVEAAKLMLDGVVVEPEANDRIKRQVGQTRVVYEVMTPPFRPSDNDGARLRILTRQIDTEPV